MANNKVLFGFSDLWIGAYNVADDGIVTFGAPYHQKGAVGYSAEPQSDSYTFYADNVAYYTSYSRGRYEGDLEVALFDKKVREDYFGQVTLADGGIAEVKNAIIPNIYVMFQVGGDQKGRRVLMLNGTFGPISRQYQTTEENVEVITESAPLSFAGANDTGISMVTYKPGDAGYELLCTSTAPPVPALPATNNNAGE